MGFNFPNAPTHGTTFSAPGGPEYVFSNGAWLQVGDPSAPITGATFFNSRASAMGSIIPPDVPSITLHGYTTPNDGGGAHYSRVLSLPTANLRHWFQSADGAYWMLAEKGEVTLEMFGGRPDGSDFNVTIPTGTDNWPALQAALDYGIKTSAAAYYSSSASIRLLRGIYYVSQTTHISRNVRISGSGAAAVGNVQPQSILTYPPDVTAFVFWAGNTPDPLPSGPAHGSESYGSILENIRIWGRGGLYLVPTTSTLTAHGIIAYTTVTIRDCIIANFSGDGLHFESGTAAVPAGSANEIDLFAVRCMLNYRHGVFIDGSDSSAGGGVRIDCSGNGGWGIWDSGYLGNGWFNCHTTNNGARMRVYHEENQYWCIHNTLGGSTEPGTDSTVWLLAGPGGETFAYPQWVSGRTYVPGGPYCTKAYLWPSPSQSDGFGHVLVNCYAEGGQGACRFNQGTLLIGGLQADAILIGPEKGTKNFFGGQIFHYPGVEERWGARQDIVGKNIPGASIMLGETVTAPIRLYATGDSTSGMSFPNWNLVTGTFDINHGVLTNPVAKFTTELTQGVEVGRGAPLGAGNVVFPNNIYVGRTLTESRLISFSPTIPAVGPLYAQGDIVFNQAPTSGENVGWICVQGGAVATTPAWTAGANEAKGNYRQHLGRFYRCTFDPSVAKSLIEPTHTFTATVVGGDGYGWTYAGPNSRIVGSPGGTNGARPVTWKTGTSYAAGKQVSNAAGVSYICTTPGGGASSGTEPVHTSGTGAARPDGYVWTFTDLTWVTGTTYPLDHLIKHDTTGIIYRCSAVGGGASTIQPSHSAIATLADQYQWEFLCDTATTPDWVTGTAYKVGDIVKNIGNDCHRVLIAGQGASTNKPEHIYPHRVRTYTDGYKWEYLCSDYSAAWEFGTIYSVAHSEEQFVRLLNSAGIGYWVKVVRNDELETSDPPVHVSGEVMTADFHKWLYVANTSPVWKTFGLVDP